MNKKHLFFSIAILIIASLIANPAFSQKNKNTKADLDASFIASIYTITAGECVDFSDMSIGNPTFWQWSFPGSQTVTSDDQDPTGICYYYAGTYDVVLEVQNSTDIDTEVIIGCITVEPNTETPIADFEASYTTIPVGGTVNFTNLSQNGPFIAYSWVFEGGIPNTSNEDTPVPIAYTEVGLYRVELSIEDEDGDQDGEVKIEYINVIPAATVPPTANFIADRVFIAPGDFINFRDMSSGNPYIWSWFFEGGFTNETDQQNPHSVSFPMPGVYDVELIVESNMGIDTIRREDYIVVSETDPCVAIPIADFEASQRLIRSGTTVYFEDKSLNSPTTWNWYFEGGYPTYSAVSNVVNGIEFNAAGFYDVSLAVNNSCGSNFVYKEDYIMVFSGPVTKYCDTITNIFENESLDSPWVSGSWGYIGGHNGQNVKYYAEKFEQYSFTTIEGLLVPVVKSEAGEYNSKVTFFIWDGNTVYPETILAQTDIYLRDIPENFNYPVSFDAPIEVEGPFFIGYKINYVDTNNDGISDDEFAVSIAHNRTYSSAINTLYVQSNSTWSTATAKFGIKTSSAMKPVTCIVDINSFEKENNIEIFPNPASDYININTGDIQNGTDVVIQLIDMTGKVLVTGNFVTGYDEIRLDLNNYPSGLYFVSLSTEGDRVTKKILVTK